MNETDAAHPSLADLAAFDSGHLSADQREAIERHLADCPTCGRRVDGLPEDPFVALVRASAGPHTLPTADTPAQPGVPDALARHPRYRILEVLGEGGMGIVYKAVHCLMDRVVALKVLPRRFTDHPEFVEHFRQEVQAIARLSHPHIALAHDAEQAGDLHFLVMEYIPGLSLDRVVARRGPLPVAEACEYVRQAALGLQHAFECGLVHRDVKPQNLMRTPARQIKVLDFGLAHLARASGEPASHPSAGVFAGTPDYAAPEQARDPGSADIRADIYGLGCTLHFLLTGQPPFPGTSPLQKLLAHQDRTPSPVSQFRPDVPARLVALLERMLAKEPAQRPATPAEVARALAPFATVTTERPRRSRWPWLLAAALLATVGVVSLFAWSPWRRERPAVEVTVPPAPVDPPSNHRSRRGGGRGEVEVAVPPAPVDPLALATPEEMRRLKDERRDQALAWLRENNRWGPDASIVQNLAADFAPYPGQIDGFLLQFGSRLLRSQQPTLLAANLGGLFVFPLTADQARALNLAETQRRFRGIRNLADRRRATSRVRLSELKIDHAPRLNFDARITGSIAYEMRGPAITRHFAVRLSWYMEGGKRQAVLYWFKDRTLEGRGTLSFAFAPLASPTYRPRGPLVLFADLCTDPEGTIVVESDTLATLVEAGPGW
jgi:hypothetical protein